MKLSPYLLLPFLMTGCMTHAVEKGEDVAKPKAASAAHTAIEAAIAMNKKAKSTGYEWRDTGKWIKKAQAAAKAGDEKKALKLAKKITAAAEDGIQQSIDQKNAGPRF